MNTQMKNCPACQSDQIKKASLIHAEGVQASGGIGVGMSHHGGLAGGVGVGVSTTALAAKCAPPKKDKDAFYKQSGNALSLVFFIPLVIAVLANGSWGETGWFWKVWAGLGFVLIAWLLSKFEKQHEIAYQKSISDYDKTYMCLRCGHFYRPFD